MVNSDSDRRKFMEFGASIALGAAGASAGLGCAASDQAVDGQSAPANLRMIDIHPHVASRDEVRYPITPIGGIRSDWSGERSITVEELIAAMDETGVAKAAIVHSSTTYGFNCEYCADAVAAYPRRLTGVFSVDVAAPDGPAAMRHWYGLNCTGARIFTRGSTIKEAWLALDDTRIEPCYRTAEDLGIPVAVNIKSEQFQQLETVLKKFPNIRFILDSLGGPDFTDGKPYEAARPLWNLEKYPNLYLKLVTGNFLRARNGKADPDTLFPRIVAEFGSDRMAWGSDYPSAPGALKDMVKLAKNTVRSLALKDQDNLFTRTALTLYPALKS